MCGDPGGLDALLSLDGMSYEAADGYVVEIKAWRVDRTPERPHGISYALVFRARGGRPLVRFDNAHAVERPGGRHVKSDRAFDHWHASERDRGKSYRFSTASTLLEDFFAAVKQVLNEKGIPNDL